MRNATPTLLLAATLVTGSADVATSAEEPSAPDGTRWPDVAATPDDAGAHLDRGASLLYQKRFDEAIVELEAALKLRPDYLKARLNLATAHFYKQDYARAEREYLRCLEQDPAYVNARFNLAICYQAQGKSDEALAAYRKVLDADPKKAQAWKNMGKIHHRRGDHRAAVDAYERSLAIDPGQKDAADVRRSADDLRLKIVEAEQRKAEAVAAVEPPTPAPAATPAPAPATPPAPPRAPPPEPTPSRPSAEAPSTSTPAPKAPSPIAPTPAPLPSVSTPPPPTAAAAPVPTPLPAVAPPEPSAPRDPAVLRKLLVSLVATQRAGSTILVSEPLGAEVYLRRDDLRLKDPFPKYGPFGAGRKSRQFVALRADIVDKKLFRGHTPMTLDLEEGHYQIAFRLPGSEESWIEDGNAHVQSPGIAARAEDLPGDLKIYELTVHAYDRPRTITSLFLKAGEPIEDLSSGCDGGPFQVPPDLRDALASYDIAEAERDAGLALLRCTSKVVLAGQNGNLVVELTGPDRFRITRVRS